MKFKKYLKLRFLPFVLVFTLCFFNYFLGEKGIAVNEQCPYNEQVYQGLQLTNLTQELEGTGLIGSIHGASPSSQLFVLSVREPENFFSHREFSLIANNQETLKTLSKVKRHDRVCIKGQIIPNPSEQKHILVESVNIIEPWSPQETYKPYQRQTSLPEELINKSSFMGKVHAIASEGQVLVVEYQDSVIPVYVESPQQTKDLFRGDIIRLNYKLQTVPTKPTHLRLNVDQSKPIEVLDSMAAWHDKEITVQGKLVKFPQSPQIKFDVYAIAVETQSITRYFTLVNFQDASEFQKIREQLARIWDAHLATATSGRNMLINPDVMLEVRGRVNVVSANQANPQILLSEVAAIKLL